MSAVSIVVDFYVLEYSSPHSRSGSNSFTMDGLDLNRMKETLRTSIVIAVALCAHAARQAVSVEQSLEGR